MRLHNAQLTISTVLNDEQQLARLAKYGYDAARLHEGLAIQAAALNARMQQHAEQGMQLSATDTHRAAQASAQATFAEHRNIAKIALRGERGLAQTLGLADARPRNQARWQGQAQQFYTNALNNPAVLAHLAGYGLTAGQLAEAQRQVTAVLDSLVTRRQLCITHK